MAKCDICGDEFDNTHGVNTHKSQVHGNGVRPKPDGVEIPEGRSWEDMGPHLRHYYENIDDERERRREYKKSVAEWYKSHKEEQSCEVCGEDRTVCLDFHHKENKDRGISDMVFNGCSIETLKRELEKCIVLCANCHRVEHE